MGLIGDDHLDAHWNRSNQVSMCCFYVLLSTISALFPIDLTHTCPNSVIAHLENSDDNLSVVD
jgi:hypothetical protein